MGIRLEKGWNRILVKANTRLLLRLTDPNGTPFGEEALAEEAEVKLHPLPTNATGTWEGPYSEATEKTWRQRLAAPAKKPLAMALEHSGLAILHKSNNRNDLAVAEAAKAIELAPDDPALRHRLATALFMAGDARGAEEQFEETLRRSPEFAKAHFGLGMILDLSGRHQEAAERFSAAVTSQPDYLEARLGLADALRVTERAEESLPHYEEIVTTDPGFAEAWIGFAMALAHLERYQEARDRLTEARTVLPDRPELADLLAQLPSY